MITAFQRDHAYAEALDIIGRCRMAATDERGWNLLFGAATYLLKQWREHQASHTRIDIQRQKQIWECND